MPMCTKKYYLICDIETGGGLGCPVPYDIGYAVCDRLGNIYESESFMLAEAFISKRINLKTAYYCDKIPQYWIDFANDSRQLVTIHTAQKRMHSAIAKYGIKDFVAYNASFDRKGLDNGMAWYTRGRETEFFKVPLNTICIWNMACQLLFTQKKYQRLATDNNWISEKGNFKTSAEMAYRYLTGEHEFTESHTGLEDVIIESQIFAKCMAMHKKVNKGIDIQCWKIPQKKDVLQQPCEAGRH